MLKIKRFLDYRKCTYCGKEYLAYAVEKINKTDFICNDCKTSYDYCTKNNKFQGKQTQISFSFEFETSSKTKELYELVKYNFIGCYDCSIQGLEWKSPIFYNKKSFHTICKKINKFSKYVGNSCGTHLHVATPYKNLIRKYQKELFLPILTEMKNNLDQTIKFWGRSFNHYCLSEISEYSRYNSFNTMSSVETLEFRLLKFINAEQYIRACDFCIDTTKFINNFIGKENFNSDQARKMGEIITNKYKEVINKCVESC